MSQAKLFMILLGCKPAGRNTEQHDIFFGIGKELRDLVPGILAFWPEAKGKVHIDAWREVGCVDGYTVAVTERSERSEIMEGMGTTKEREAMKTADAGEGKHTLFFINLGGYREKEFEEFHYKMLIVASGIEEAKDKAKQAVFYKRTSLEESATHHSATAHIDDKYGIDIDDVYNIQDILPGSMKERYEIRISLNVSGLPDEYNLGYLKLDEI